MTTDERERLSDLKRQSDTCLRRPDPHNRRAGVGITALKRRQQRRRARQRVRQWLAGESAA